MSGRIDHRSVRRLLVMFICTAAFLAGSACMAFAAGPYDYTLTEGDVVKGLGAKDVTFDSADKSIAWVDSDGNLNAMKEGETLITARKNGAVSKTYKVKVNDYTDGSEIVGRLKILARYNDSMAFYDGHAYLLFTSYQDGVDITVNDLYGGYEISDQYYKDIRESISNGSNHTGSDTDKYFTFRKDMTTMRLDRGEIVTIGMYRGFDLTVPQAALGSLKNSTLWKKLTEEGKTRAVEAIFKMLDSGTIPQEDAVAALIAIFKEAGLDYQSWLDGVVEGGVCFNRELYNQKLEWDQYENVTYELDITRKQLETLVMYLNGNLNKFNLLKNSCATVALRAWNAGIGTRNGEPTSYWLSAKGKGIYSIMDAPKGVRDAIRGRLPGYYLNNSEGVAEPDAGYEDNTGWVYVSAPEPVNPAVYAYADDTIIIDQKRSKVASVIDAAKAGTDISYNKDSQQINIAVNWKVSGDVTTISSIDFTINGKKVTAGAGKIPERGVWFSVKVAAPPAGQDYYVMDTAGAVLPSEYENGRLVFHAEALPVSFKIISTAEGAHNIIRTKIIKPDGLAADADIYYYDKDGRKVTIGAQAEIKEGTKIYIKPLIADDDFDSILTGIKMNGKDIMSEQDFDAKEGAYFTVIPKSYSRLEVMFDRGAATAEQRNPVQVSVNDKLDVSDYVELLLGDDKKQSDMIRWYVIYDADGVLGLDRSGRVLTAKKPGTAYAWAGSSSNSNIGVLCTIEVSKDLSKMVTVTYDDKSGDYALYRKNGAGPDYIPYSGYKVEKGTVLYLEPQQQKQEAVYSVTVNKSRLAPGQPITITEDTDIKVKFANAEVKGLPKKIELEKKGDMYKLNAEVAYTGFYRLLPVYDKSITFESSDPAVTVDSTGLIRVTGDIPESGKEVIVTAYAGSSNRKVFAECRVNIGDYVGAKIVGRLTISALSAYKETLALHGAVTFTTYDDLDLNVSYYHYYKPQEKLIELLDDYDEHPGKYGSDPALFSNNELGISDRESYFKDIFAGSGSEPRKISLRAGESISVSNYGYETVNMISALKVFENGDIASSESAQELIRQMRIYIDGGKIDGGNAFDSLVKTLTQAYMMAYMTGYNPINGTLEGGLDVNREMYNYFRANKSPFPNNYYTIEITADELAQLQKYLADPNNNFYSIFVKNCGTGAIDAWNAALFDKPELHLTGNYTKFAAEPESLYIELGLLRKKKGIDGQGGTDFYPRAVRNSSLWTVTDQNNIKINSALKVSQTGSKVSAKWGKVPAAAKYEVYAAFCGKGKMKLVGMLTGNSLSFKKIGGKKISLTKNMKVQVVALNRRGNVIAKSQVAHIIGRKNKKYSNPKKIKVSKSKYTIKTGKTAKIKAKTVLVSKNKKDLTNKHARKFRYASTDKLVATVSSKSVIKGKAKGTCYIYVYARNGFPKKIKVTVK